MAKYSVAGTGHENRAIGIRKWCKGSGKVILKREPKNKYDENAIAIYIIAKMLFGLIKSEYQIGYIKAEAAKRIATKLDNNEKFEASVSRVYCPEGMNWPEVTIDVVFN